MTTFMGIEKFFLVCVIMLDDCQPFKFFLEFYPFILTDWWLTIYSHTLASDISYSCALLCINVR